MAYRRRHPLRDILDLQDRMNRVFEESMRERIPGQCNPPVDVFEDDEALYIKAELPGVRREDVILDFSEGVVTISGKKAFTHDNQKESFHMIERQYGSFKRRFSLSQSVDISAVQAKLESGVLEITFPKIKDSTSRRILISEK